MSKIVKRALILAVIATLIAAWAPHGGNRGGGGPPPGCSNKLDFTQACNSQYVGVF